MTSTVALHAHRQNKRGSHTSMSLTCFASVDCSKAKTELAEEYRANVLNSGFLAERGCLSRAESMRHPAPNHAA
jgi:hypothetical protein